jgi:nucleoside-diphosphate-sugar epimerase
MNGSSFKRTLVTGATGYIGSNLVRHLLAEGWDVHIVIRPNSDLQVLGTELDKLTVHSHDGTSSGMVDVLANAKPDIVFHLASLFLAQHQTDDVEALISCNLLFPTQLLEAMAATDVRYLVNTGTSWQHYEDKAYNPVNLYAATKQAFEDILTYYIEAHYLKATTLVLFDTYGPNDPRAKLIPLLLKTAYSKQPVSMSPGEQSIDLVYIDDVVRAYSLAAHALEIQVDGHTRYGVSSGAPIRLIDLVVAFQNATQATLPITFGGRPYRAREVMFPWTNYQSVPGWRPFVSLDRGLEIVCRGALTFD